MNEIEEILESLKISISNNFIDSLKSRLKLLSDDNNLISRIDKVDSLIHENQNLNNNDGITYKTELAYISLAILSLEKEILLAKSNKEHEIYIKIKNEYNTLLKKIKNKKANNLEKLEFEIDDKQQELKKRESSYIFSEYKDVNRKYEDFKEKINNLKQLVDKQDNKSDDFDSEHIKYCIEIELTSSNYLNNDNEKQMRYDLFHDLLGSPKLSIIHDNNNSYDSLAIMVLCNNISIGYILKYKDKENINSFCFEDNKLDSIEIIYTKGVFELCVQEVKPVEIIKENTEYSQTLYSISQPSFNRIRQININNDEDSELSKYIINQGKSDKAKLYSAYDVLFEDYLEDKTINIIDWRCGQALGTSILIDYLRDKDIDTTISNIVLTDPSDIALERGLLHIDVLKDEEYNVRAVNKDIDSVNHSDIKISNSDINLHIFLNILDMDNLDLDMLCSKIEDVSKNDNYFVCVSPNTTENRNNRLDEFYDFFNTKYNTQVISKRDKNIGNYNRYEIIFKVVLESKNDDEWIGKLWKWADNNNISHVLLSRDKGILLTQSELNLSRHKLTSLSEEIGNLTRLKKLDISHNKLLALPKEICYLENLQELNFGMNLNLVLTTNQIKWLTNIKQRKKYD